MGRPAGAGVATLVCAVALCVLIPLSHGLPYEVEHDGVERQMWCKCSTYKCAGMVKRVAPRAKAQPEFEGFAALLSIQREHLMGGGHRCGSFEPLSMIVE